LLYTCINIQHWEYNFFTSWILNGWFTLSLKHINFETIQQQNLQNGSVIIFNKWYKSFLSLSCSLEWLHWSYCLIIMHLLTNIHSYYACIFFSLPERIKIVLMLVRQHFTSLKEKKMSYLYYTVPYMYMYFPKQFIHGTAL